MPSKYDEQTRSKAVRLVQDHQGDYAWEWEAIKTVSGRLGMNAETLRKWLPQAQVDAGQTEDRRGETILDRGRPGQIQRHVTWRHRLVQ